MESSSPSHPCGSKNFKLPRNNPPDFTQYNSEWPSFTFKPEKGNHIMFNIEEVRKNNRTDLLISSFAAHIAAIALELSRDGSNGLHCYGGFESSQE
jgi:hypothetical protein